MVPSVPFGMSILEGDGDFIIGPTAKLYIGSEAGIDEKRRKRKHPT